MNSLKRVLSVWKLGRLLLAAILVTAGALMPGFASATPLQTASAGVTRRLHRGLRSPGRHGTSGGAISFHVFCSDTFGTASATGSAGIGHAGASATAATFDPFSGFASESGPAGLFRHCHFPCLGPDRFSGGHCGIAQSGVRRDTDFDFGGGGSRRRIVDQRGTVANLHDTTNNGTDTSCNSSFLGGEGCASPATDGKVTSQDRWCSTPHTG